MIDSIILKHKLSMDKNLHSNMQCFLLDLNYQFYFILVLNLLLIMEKRNQYQLIFPSKERVLNTHITVFCAFVSRERNR